MSTLEILDNTGLKVAQLSSAECTAKVRRKINGEWAISIFYPIPTGQQGENKSTFFDAWKARARVRDQDSGTYQTFVLSKPETYRETDGRIGVRVEGEHVALNTMAGEIVDRTYDFQNVTPTYALTLILTRSVYDVGTIGITTPVSFQVSYESVLSALQKLLAACGGEYDVDEVNSQIDINSSLGSTTKYIQIRPGRNLKSIKRIRYSRDVVTRMYGVGGGQPVATIAGALHRVISVIGQVVMVDHDKLVPENGTWVDFKIRVATGTLAGSKFTIANSNHYPANDTLTLSGTLTGLAAGDMIVIIDYYETDVPYIIAQSAVTSYGTIEGVYRNSRYSNTINLVKTAALDGTYTAGLCQNWTKEGSPTVSQETGSTYIDYGSACQKLIGASNNDGLSQIVSVESGKWYQISVYIYVGAGSVKIQVSTGSKSYTTSGTSITGKITLGGVLKSLGTTITIKILQSGVTAATFYIDAVQVSETEKSGTSFVQKPFCIVSDKTMLWHETFDALIKAKSPQVEYQANFIDLHRIAPTDYPFDEIDIGDTVVVTDSEIGINSVSARVKEIVFDTFQPELTEHTISTVE